MDRGAWQAAAHRVAQELDTTEATKQQAFPIKKSIKYIVHSVVHTNVSTIWVLDKTFVVIIA